MGEYPVNAMRSRVVEPRVERSDDMALGVGQDNIYFSVLYFSARRYFHRMYLEIEIQQNVDDLRAGAPRER
ncbi:MAG: hypothetical protein B7Z66_11045 [Chromatiales bacterium 21-64-14]|nr:MAG: hypothetical protein B7Z66_11045 [Chromatiales bacterium 21-64-14]